jgi:hypothetical protein
MPDFFRPGGPDGEACAGTCTGESGVRALALSRDLYQKFSCRELMLLGKYFHGLMFHITCADSDPVRASMHFNKNGE